MTTWLYKFADGTHEVCVLDSRDYDRYHKLIQRAYFILDLTTGEVKKDRYTGNTGHIISHKALVEYRRQFGYHRKPKEHFEDDLFVL